MFQLTLMRHAKSSQAKPGMTDFDRPLNKRGLKDAPFMGSVCNDHLPPPELALISPAQRTRQTAELLFTSWKSAQPKQIFENEFYLAGYDTWIDYLRISCSTFSHVLICAHQPGIGNLVSWLCADFRKDVPTATVISLLFSDHVLEPGGGTLHFFARPGDVLD